ncbi:hypothetical protein ACR3K2_22040 [Cryptosporidium serpentis]
MVSIVSTAQVGRIVDDSNTGRTGKIHRRKCGIWGTAYCCLSLKTSVIMIAITYGFLYLIVKFSFLTITAVNSTMNLAGINFSLNMLNKISLNDLKKYFGNFFALPLKEVVTNIDSNTVFTFQVILINYLNISSFIYGCLFMTGLISGIASWFWATVTFLVLIWLDVIKNITGVLFFSFMVIKNLQSWWMYFYIFLGVASVLLFILLCFYYTIQVTYSLYLVQLAGGRGNEKVPYFKLRRMVPSSTTYLGTSPRSSTRIASRIDPNIDSTADETNPLLHKESSNVQQLV